MKIFKFKYLIASLVMHSALVSIFLLSKDLLKKPETSILVTEIVKIEEIEKSNDIKKEDPIANKKESVDLKKPKEKNISIVTKLELQKTRSRSKQSKSEQKTRAIKHPQNKNNIQKNLGSFDIKPNANVTNKELSKAIYKIGSVNNPHPPYPIMARKKGLQGKLILGVSVNNDGSVKNVSIKKSSGHRILDKVSKETIEKWIFVPAKKLGLAVEDSIQVPIRFVLTD
tara:strand:- start:545 stop:1225 length:681 start_codon:yes stop_codon:yes gene_type:complete